MQYSGDFVFLLETFFTPFFCFENISQSLGSIPDVCIAHIEGCKTKSHYARSSKISNYFSGNKSLNYRKTI